MKLTHTIDSQINYQLLTTTTTLGRVRGFSIELLFMLNEGGGRCCDLSERSGKTQPYIHRYLRNLRNYGLVTQNDAFWFLTDLGKEFVKYLNIVYNNIIDYRKKKERKKKVRRKKIERLNLNSQDSKGKELVKKPKFLKQVKIDLWLRGSGLEDSEKEVVEVLVKHFNETGSKFLYFKDHYDIAERFGIRPDQVNPILMHLKQDNIIYTFRDRNHDAWKLGLKKAFVETLARASRE